MEVFEESQLSRVRSLGAIEVFSGNSLGSRSVLGIRKIEKIGKFSNKFVF